MATIIKRGSKWAARVRIKGISLSQSFVTKAQAQAWATQTEAKILSGDYDSVSDKTLGDAIDRYLVECMPKKKSIRAETAQLMMIRRHEIAKTKLSRLTTEALAQLRDEFLARVKPASARRYLLLISAIMETARKEWQWIKINPVKDLKKPPVGKPRDRVFSEEEITLFCDLVLAREYYTDVTKMVVDCFLFAIETGMRAGEICGLEWADIDGRVATLHDTKNGDKRRVPLSLKALEILNSRRTFPRPFTITSKNLSVMFARYIKYCGIEGVTFHDTRHTATTRLAKKLQPFELARMLGHRNMTQTLFYYNESAESIADKLD